MNDNNGIGSLNEHALHLALKKYLDPDESHHEIPVGGFVADIKDGDRIIEIETRSFSNLRKKLPILLKDHHVTVVFPIAENSSFVILDEDGKSGTVRKSTKKGRPSDIFGELLKVTGFIGHPRLTFTIILIDTLEYRINVKRRGRNGTKRADRVPTNYNGIIELRTAEDVASLVMIQEGEFTAAAFARANKMRQYDSWETLRVLEDIGVVACNRGKRPFVYHKTD